MCSMIYISSRGCIGTLRKKARRLYRPSATTSPPRPNMSICYIINLYVYYYREHRMSYLCAVMCMKYDIDIYLYCHIVHVTFVT